MARFYRAPEEVDSIDITNCVMAIISVSKLADFINEYSEGQTEAAKALAYQIKLIQTALAPQIEMLQEKRRP